MSLLDMTLNDLHCDALRVVNVDAYGFICSRLLSEQKYLACVSMTPF
jgi:hypothetical protein